MVNGRLLVLMVLVKGIWVALCDAQKHSDITRVGESISLVCEHEGNVSWSWTQLQKKRTTDEWTPKRWIQKHSALNLRDAQIEDSGIYRCSDSKENVINEYKITVGEPPSMPTNLSCITHHSLSYTRCCWNVGTYPGIDTKFSLRYTMRRGMWFRPEQSLRVKRVGSCSEQHKTLADSIISPLCCDLPTSYKPNRTMDVVQLDIQLQSENALGKATAENQTELPFSWVKSTPPSDLHVNVEEEVNTYILTASWKPPNMTIDSFMYTLRYRVSPDLDWQTLEMILKPERVFEVRRSHSKVEIQVTAQPHRPYGGFDSEWTPSAFAFTGVIAPSSRLKYDQVISDLFEDSVVITANWIEYGRPDEPGLHVQIGVSRCGEDRMLMENVTHGRTSFTSLMNSTDCIQISGSYCNAMGCSDATKIQVDPSQTNHYDAAVTLNKSKEGFVASWISKTHLVSGISCLAKIMSAHRVKRNGSVLNVRQVITEKKNVSCGAGNLTISKSLSMCSEYFAVVGIVNVIQGVTYMRTYRSSTKQLSDDISRPFTWSVTSADKAEFRVSSLSVPGLNCSKIRPRIFFTALNGSECIRQIGTCRTKYVSEALNCNNTGQIVSDNVYGDTTYEIAIAACCLNELSLDTGKPICLRAPSSGFKVIRTPITAPGPPVNFRWLDNEKITWDSPIRENGPISGYLISIKADSKMENITTPKEEVSYNKICDDTSAALEVQAFTISKKEKIIYGIPNKLPENICKGALLERNSILMIVISIFAILSIIVATAVACCHRKRIKHIISQTIWPRIPRPNLIVSFQSGLRELSVDELENAPFERDLTTLQPLSQEEENRHEIQQPLLFTEEANTESCQMMETTNAIVETTSPNENSSQREGFASPSDQPTSHKEKSQFFTHRNFMMGRTSDNIPSVPQIRQHRCQSFPGCLTASLGEQVSSNHAPRSAASGLGVDAKLPLVATTPLQQRNNHVSLESIPSYLSCSETRIYSPFAQYEKSRQRSRYPSTRADGQRSYPDYESSISENYAFFDSSWSGSLQCCTPLGLGEDHRVFLNHKESESVNLLMSRTGDEAMATLSFGQCDS